MPTPSPLPFQAPSLVFILSGFLTYGAQLNVLWLLGGTQSNQVGEEATPPGSSSQHQDWVGRDIASRRSSTSEPRQLRWSSLGQREFRSLSPTPSSLQAVSRTDSSEAEKPYRASDLAGTAFPLRHRSSTAHRELPRSSHGRDKCEEGEGLGQEGGGELCGRQHPFAL